VERSIPQAVPGEAADEIRRAPDQGSEPAGGESADSSVEGPSTRALTIGYGLVAACFLVYFLIHLDRPNNYLHFVLQAQAWLDGATSIPMPQYQDVMPILGPDGVPTGRGIIPFPPLPAWVLLPVVAIWHYATNQQLLSAIFGAVDVGLAYWMLGRLPIRPAIRILTALFLGLGTVLFYTSVIGTTWFWAHIVAVACLLLAVGLALGADPEATEAEPDGAMRAAAHGAIVPGGWRTAVLVVAAGVLGETFLLLSGSGAPAATLAALGLVLGILAALVAVAVAGRWRVLVAPGLVLLIVAGVPGLFLIAALSIELTYAVDGALVAIVAAVAVLAFRGGEAEGRVWSAVSRALTDPESLQVAAGMLFGLAVTARLTVLFGFPFFMLVGGGGSWMRRTLLAGAGAAVPLLALLVVTYATSGQLFNPAYDYLYRNEVIQYGAVFDYNAAWAISDIRYIPQNLMIMLFQGPEIAPNFVGIAGPDYGTTACTAVDATRGLFDTACPLAMPNATGMSLLLASPAFLVAPFAWRPRLDRATVGAAVALLGIAFVNLMHFSQGWVQFGYRFSNDFVPFALVLVALGAARLGRYWPAFGLLVVLSIVVNFWGTTWGTILGW
jgi:hypothetical protein